MEKNNFVCTLLFSILVLLGITVVVIVIAPIEVIIPIHYEGVSLKLISYRYHMHNIRVVILLQIPRILLFYH